MQDEIKKLDWDQILGNVLRLIRVIIFQSSVSEPADLEQAETARILHGVMLNLMPSKSSFSILLLIKGIY